MLQKEKNSFVTTARRSFAPKLLSFFK